MPDFTVHQYGTDSSGRAILMTTYMHRWLEDVKADLDFTPVVVQGAFQERLGGGAADSAGYHDLGGCLDFRTRDLTSAQRNALIAACRAHGAAAWRRDQVHGGMDEHAHIVLGTDSPIASGAAQQWRDYINGYDGLYYRDGRKRPDYEERPDPLVLTPPEADMTPEQAKQLDGLTKAVASLADMVEALAEGNEAIKRRITRSKREIKDAIGRKL